MTKGNGHDAPREAPQVTSLDDARRAAQKKAKAELQAAVPNGSSTTRDWLIGGVIIAMAIGMIVSWLMGAVRAADRKSNQLVPGDIGSTSARCHPGSLPVVMGLGAATGKGSGSDHSMLSRSCPGTNQPKPIGGGSA